MVQNEFYKRLSSNLTEEKIKLMDQVVALSHGLERHGSFLEAGLWAFDAAKDGVTWELYRTKSIKSYGELIERINTVRSASISMRRKMTPEVRHVLRAKMDQNHSNYWDELPILLRELQKMRKEGKI
ncbi:MAG: hypothetical protein V1835_07330 [Candidatus Micrarchaeota archaeon]